MELKEKIPSIEFETAAGTVEIIPNPAQSHRVLIITPLGENEFIPMPQRSSEYQEFVNRKSNNRFRLHYRRCLVTQRDFKTAFYLSNGKCWLFEEGHFPTLLPNGEEIYNTFKSHEKRRLGHVIVLEDKELYYYKSFPMELLGAPLNAKQLAELGFRYIEINEKKILYHPSYCGVRIYERDDEVFFLGKSEMRDCLRV